MKALVQDEYGTAAEVMRVEEIPRPTIADDRVLVRVHAAGIDAGVWHLMTGLPLLARLAIGLRKPRTRVRGMELAGTVEAVGSAVTGLAVGDEVFGGGEGAFAEYAIAKPQHLALKPSHVSFEQAAALTISGHTALQALRDAGRLVAGQHVLVIGAAGGVGSYAVQIAKAMGASVTGVCSTRKLDFVRSLGADHVVDYMRDDLGSERYDLIIDTAGARPLSVLRRSLVAGGTLVIVGSEGGGRVAGGLGRQMVAPLVGRFTGHRMVGLISLQKAADLEVLRGMLDARTIVPAIESVIALADGPAAIDRLAAGGARGKVVLVP